MASIKKTVLVTHSAAEMFELVDNVLEYPNFLPWCSHAEVIKREGNTLEARVFMDYMKIKNHFATRNHNTPFSEIQMSFLEGPFKKLNGVWQFQAIGDTACKINFSLDYEFSSVLLSKVIGPVFGAISGSLVNSFVKEANRRYAK